MVQIRITRPNPGDLNVTGAIVKINFTGVLNPTAAGVYNIQVQTFDDKNNTMNNITNASVTITSNVSGYSVAFNETVAGL